jgi:hypothetical protein
MTILLCHKGNLEVHSTCSLSILQLLAGSIKLGKLAFRCYQASPRGGVVQVTLAGERALISGQAVTVLRGELATAALPSDGAGEATTP